MSVERNGVDDAVGACGLPVNHVGRADGAQEVRVCADGGGGGKHYEVFEIKKLKKSIKIYNPLIRNINNISTSS